MRPEAKRIPLKTATVKAERIQQHLAPGIGCVAWPPQRDYLSRPALAERSTLAEGVTVAFLQGMKCCCVLDCAWMWHSNAL